MVNLTKIYTRTGDTGTTRLGSGDAVAKTDARVDAFGDVDETNAAIGVVLSAALSPLTQRLLKPVQNDLFDLGADLCVPVSAPTGGRPPLRVTSAHVDRLEIAIDAANADLGDLRSFVLPGGTAAAAWLHMARTVCRRAERRAWELVADVEEGAVNEQALKYLNRLSDLLFVLSRVENAASGVEDVLWQPGGDVSP
ncbi:MAG: cob(I)yrinic acid a,c-diamide adenosyltransferase [Candidatus Latescibacterota bacterium]|jgi:cob(I)alamin adenosyltransferase